MAETSAAVVEQTAAVEPVSRHPFMDKYTKPVKRSPREIVGRKDEMLMLEACLNRPELCNAMLLGEAGSGKSLKNGTEIPGVFPYGYKRIEDLVPGDFVYDENGSPVKVLGVYPQGMKRAFRVTFADGTTIVCNNEHLWAARTRKQHYTDSAFRIHTLQDMMDYGLIHVRSGKRMQFLKNWYVPCNQAVQREAVDLPVHPYAVGAFLGDGCLTREYQLEISSADESVVRRVAEFIGAVDVESREGCHGWMFIREDATPSKKFIQCKELFADSMFDVMSGQYSINRRIPRPYMTGSIEQRWELLRGLMDTDGTVTNNDRTSCCLTTGSAGLVEDVRELAASLGMRTSMNCHVRQNDIHVNPEYEVHFVVPDNMKEDLFWLDRHKVTIQKNIRDDRRFNKHFDDIAIASVEDLGYDAEMTCIYVDGPSHLFQAGRAHIVTHNTMLVQGTMAKDVNRYYVEVNLAKMIADYDPITLGNSLTQLFDEVQIMRDEIGKEVVLFIDEFHQIVQLSPAAVEAMKPLLADSGTRGIKVIAATTFVEFRQWIAPNQPLVERLQRINLSQPGKAMTVGILKGVAKTYGVDTQFYNDSMYEMIYELTNRYVPANSQPRKSILIMDAMVGWHRATGRPLDKKLLADVIYQSEGVNISFRVDATNIKKRLDTYVYAQELASSLITNRLHIAVADLNDKSKPMASFLFTGSTGTGKTEMTKTLASILFGSGREEDGDENQSSNRNLIRFDMTEYANKESLDRFRAEITARVWERPYCVLLLDEIEKACAEVTRLLLQVLDDGRLSDENGRQVPFTNCYIVLTTNAGSEIYKTISQYNSSDTGDGAVMKRYNKLIRQSISQTTGDNRFPPELLGRIDAIIPFQPLSEETMRRIVKSKLMKLVKEVSKKHNVELRIDKCVVDYLVLDNLDTDSNSGGARIVVTKMIEEITTPVAQFINENPDVRIVGVRVEGDMAYEHKNMLASEAYIKVAAQI